MDLREERLARNQTIFREVNERVADAARKQRADEPVAYPFFCECSDAACVERLQLTLGEYEALRANPTWFVIALGHERPEIEQVVRENGDWEIVQKLDEAGAIVAAGDPRGQAPPLQE